MKNEKKNNLFEEHLRKIKFRTDYIISESPRYRPLVNDGEEYDDMPLTNEAGDQEDAPKPEGEVPPAPSNDQPITPDSPVPAFDKTGGDPMAEPPVDPNMPPIAGEVPADPMAEPTQQVDSIQNDIIKHNIAAMQSIHDKLESLDNTVQGLNSKLLTLNADVEEVREPTNTEKLMSKKNVSYPYYFNLNDFWSGNWFNEKRNQEMEKGIKELPDGTFVADFDDLPQKSKIDVQNSFNEIYESVGKKNRLKEGSEQQYSANNDGSKSEIDGSASKKTAISRIYAKASPLTKGFFRDTDWGNIHKVFDVFDAMNLDWSITKAEYDGSQPPERKTWYLEINYIDSMGKSKQIGGYLVAAGAGSVQDPLDKYDMIFVLY